MLVSQGLLSTIIDEVDKIHFHLIIICLFHEQSLTHLDLA